MDRSEAIQRLKTCEVAAKDLGVISLYLFGSTARGEASNLSDLDVFIDHDPDARFSLIDLAGIKLMLEEHLAAEVDITTRSSLHPLLKADIERSAIQVF